MQTTDLVLPFTRRLDSLGARYMVSDSVAASIYGAPRLTNDVDLIVVLDRAQIERMPGIFAEDEFYCPPVEAMLEEAARDERGHFNIIHHETGFKADIYPTGHDALHAWALARTRTLSVAGGSLSVAPPEYVILRKLEYYREGGSEKLLRDIRSMLDVAADAINRAEIERMVAERGLAQAWRKAQAIAG
jgi:hypothetical protein